MKTFLSFVAGFLFFSIVAMAAQWPDLNRRIAVIDAQNIQLSIDVQSLAADVKRLHETTVSALQETTADLKADLGELRSGQNVVIRTQQEDRAAQWKQYQRQNKVMRHFHHHHPSQGEFK